jgi:hypothetical protein
LNYSFSCFNKALRLEIKVEEKKTASILAHLGSSSKNERETIATNPSSAPQNLIHDILDGEEMMRTNVLLHRGSVIDHIRQKIRGEAMKIMNATKMTRSTTNNSGVTSTISTEPSSDQNTPHSIEGNNNNNIAIIEEDDDDEEEMEDDEEEEEDEDEHNNNHINKEGAEALFHSSFLQSFAASDNKKNNSNGNNPWNDHTMTISPSSGNTSINPALRMNNPSGCPSSSSPTAVEIRYEFFFLLFLFLIRFLLFLFFVFLEEKETGFMRKPLETERNNC